MSKTKEIAPIGWPSEKELESQCKSHLITGDTQFQVSCVENTLSTCNEYTELENRFGKHKLRGFDLAESYRRISLLPENEPISGNVRDGYWFKRSEHVDRCGSFLEFAHEFDGVSVSPDGKLHLANFCKDRLCPMCQWRRSLKIFGQVSQILDSIADQYTFLFLTLTVPNCSGDALVITLNRLNSAFDTLMRYKSVKVAVKGYFRALEITYNRFRDSFHPHFHCILAVPKGYLEKKTAHKGESLYIPHSDWLNMWRRAYKDDSIKMVNIKAISKRMVNDEMLSDAENLKKAVAEACKYSVKSKDFLFSDCDLTDKVVQLYATSLHHRRLASFSGCFKDEYIRLGLDDVESDSADLTHISGKLNPALAWLICRYEWGYGTYKLTSTRLESPEAHK